MGSSPSSIERVTSLVTPDRGEKTKEDESIKPRKCSRVTKEDDTATSRKSNAGNQTRQNKGGLPIYIASQAVNCGQNSDIITREGCQFEKIDFYMVDPPGPDI